MKIRPLQDRVVLKRMEQEQKSAGGIIIPDTVKEKPQKGEIVAVGPGKRNDKGALEPLAVKKGDKVLFAKYAGTEIKVEGEDLLIMREDDLMGIIED